MLKNTRFIIIIICCLFVFGFASAVLAQGEASTATQSLANAGLLPDSPFYFLKTWKEKIQIFFTFGAENKARQFMHLAEVRLAEYQKMMENGIFLIHNPFSCIFV